jgi:hypothetical protein
MKLEILTVAVLLTGVSMAMFPMTVFAGEAGSTSAGPSGPFSGSTPSMQEDILRTFPDDSAPFVDLRKPEGGSPPKVEVLSRQGDWEEVRLRYWFKYNGSRDPRICKMSLFEGTFTGFRKAER